MAAVLARLKSRPPPVTYWLLTTDYWLLVVTGYGLLPITALS